LHYLRRSILFFFNNKTKDDLERCRAFSSVPYRSPDAHTIIASNHDWCVWGEMMVCASGRYTPRRFVWLVPRVTGLFPPLPCVYLMTCLPTLGLPLAWNDKVIHPAYFPGWMLAFASAFSIRTSWRVRSNS